MTLTMHRCALLIVAIAMLVTHAETAASQVTGPLALGHSEPLTETVQIDGRLEESMWSSAQLVPLLLETNPRQNAPAPVSTTCRIARDAVHLYLGCSASDPRPAEIRAQYKDRDQIEGHDRIVLYLDTFDDGQRAYVFEISAVGVQADAVFDQTGSLTDYSWNGVWSSAGRITDGGFTIEAAIPLRSLRYPSGSDRHWRFFVQRIWPRSQEVTLRSSPRNEGNSCVLCDTDLMSAPSADARLANVQLTPSLTTARTDRRSSTGNSLIPGSVNPDVGMDVHWGITSGVALAATINPDFSQVASDAVQLEANNQFALFVPERRDFFLQESELFTTPLQAVFTRSIADPTMGAKLTGRSGAYAGGILYARDAITSLLFPGPFGSSTTVLAQTADVLIARGSRSLGTTSRLGTLLTHRQGAGYHNSLGGVDAFLRPRAPVEIRFQLLGSNTAYPTATSVAFKEPGRAFSGIGMMIDSRYTTRDWSFRARLESLDAGLRADAGFITRVDTRSAELSFARRFRLDNNKWFTRLDWMGGAWQAESQTGELRDHGLWTAVRYFGPWQTTLSVNPILVTDRYLGVDYARWGLNLSAAARPNALFGTAVRVFRGTAIDYTNIRLADVHETNASADVRLGRRVSFEFGASARRLSLGRDLIVREQIGNITGVYGLTNRAFFRVLGQVRSTRRDPKRYSKTIDGHALRLESQAVLTYRLNGQTAGFLGYSTLASDSRLQGVPLDVRRQTQTLFLKVAYAWRP